MALVVETGQGLTNADAYASVAECDDYHAKYGNPTAWTDATDAAKETAIRIATQFIDLEYGTRWRGTARSSEQALDWPRFAVRNDDGGIFYEGVFYATLPYDVVPSEIKNATAYLALRSVNGDDFLPDLQDSASVLEKTTKVGPITTTKRYSGSGEHPHKEYPFVNRMLAKLIYPPGRIYIG